MSKTFGNINMNPGMDLLESEGWTPSKEFLGKIKKGGSSWIARKPVYIPLALGMSVADGFVLYSLTNIAMQQSAVMGYLMALTVAIILNVLPMIIAHYIHHMIYRTRRFAWAAVIGCTVTFIVLFAATVNLRYEYKEIYGDGSVEKIVNVVSTEEDAVEEKGSDAPDTKAMAVFWLLALEPLCSSLAILVLGLMGDNNIRALIYDLKMRRVELLEKKSDCEAALADMDSDVDRMLEIDLQKSIAVKEQINAMRLTLMAVARQILAEELGDATSISYLSAEMADDISGNDGDGAGGGEITYEGPIPYESYTDGLRVTG